MYFEKEISGGRAFMELERRGGRIEIKRRGFVARFKTNGFNPTPTWQATESPLIHDGSQCTLSTTQNAQNSTVSGSTLAGPSGSGQFLCVVISTAASRTVSIATSTSGLSFATSPFYGVLQNKPAPGQAADVGIFGLSKVVAGSTSIVAGSILTMSSGAGSSLNGTVNLWSAGTAPKIGISLEAPTAVGQVITAAIIGPNALCFGTT